MKVRTIPTLESIPLVWMTIGFLVVCSLILLAVIAIARPFITKSNIGAPVVQAQATLSTYSGSYSSDSTGLYPPAPLISSTM